MRTTHALPVLLLALGSCASPAEDGEAYGGGAEQLVAVRTPAWEATEGMLRRYERSVGGAWRSVGEPVPVVVGRSGLGWGRGLHGRAPGAGPEKREGDGRSPAGIFRLGAAFGSAPEEDARWIRLPYLSLTAEIECVDDPASASYNRIVRSGPDRDWKSAERMLEIGAPYRWGVVVEHNADPPSPGAGSCIFLHLWSDPKSPTAGCTATDPESMEALLRWLDPEAVPRIVQLPDEEWERLRRPWDLPEG